MRLKVLQETFRAQLDMMPPRPPRLHVTGTVEAPTLGWSVRLEKARPPGINPTIIILEIRATEPSGPSGDQIEPHELRYDESPAEERYRQATIRYEDLEFTIPVEITT
jgi:hypothetical protein